MAVHKYNYPELLNQIKKLSTSEKILLVEDIWDSINFSDDDLSVTDKQKTELDKRLLEYKKNPNDGSSWEEVKNRLKSDL